MNQFGGISSGDARRAHLALVTGTSVGADRTNESVLAARGRTPDLRATTYSAARHGVSSLEGVRSRHERGVRAVASAYATFEDALLPMVLASGVSGESAPAVRDAILGNPALRAQAQRAYARARADRS
jgi:hypothetical protein